MKNSAWAIEKLYRKTCVRKGLLRVIYTTITSIMEAQFLPVFKRSSVHSFTRRDYIPGKIDHCNYTSVEKM